MSPFFTAPIVKRSIIPLYSNDIVLRGEGMNIIIRNYISFDSFKCRFNSFGSPNRFLGVEEFRVSGLNGLKMPPIINNCVLPPF